MKKPRLTGIRIIHEDLDVIVVEKSAGILSQALRHCDDPSVESELTEYLRKGQWKSSKRAYLVHRLDRETSGVMMVAKTEKAQSWLRERWNEITEKVYLARVEGTLETDSGAFESYLREDEDYFVKSVKNPQYGKYARTEWKSLLPADLKDRPAQDGEASGPAAHDGETSGPAAHDGAPAEPPRTAAGTGSTPAEALGIRLGQVDPSGRPGTEKTTLVEVALKSGRKNQIRVHFSENGHPVAGDSKYGNGRRGDRLCLHAWKLTFKHPHTGKKMSFQTDLPNFATGVPAPVHTEARRHEARANAGKPGRDGAPRGPRPK